MPSPTACSPPCGCSPPSGLQANFPSPITWQSNSLPPESWARSPSCSHKKPSVTAPALFWPSPPLGPPPHAVSSKERSVMGIIDFFIANRIVGWSHQCSNYRRPNVRPANFFQVGHLLCRSGATQEPLGSASMVWTERTYHRGRRQAALGRLTPIELDTLTAMRRAATSPRLLGPKGLR